MVQLDSPLRIRAWVVDWKKNGDNLPNRLLVSITLIVNGGPFLRLDVIPGPIEKDVIIVVV